MTGEFTAGEGSELINVSAQTLSRTVDIDTGVKRPFSGWDVRDEDVWGGVKHNFETLDQFQSAVNLEDGLTKIGIGPTFVDIYATIRHGNPLFIYFNGAPKDRRSVKFPIFSGSRIHPSDECSRLSISDPALHISEKFKLGWYAGSKYFETQKIVIPAILDKIISLAKPSTIVFVGGSGGGFASLFFSRLCPGSIAVVCNPQTNILRYHKTMVRKFLSICYNVYSISAAAKDSEVTCRITKDLCRMYDPRKGGLRNKIIYMQNINDRFHYEQHYRLFAQALGVTVADEVGFSQQGNFLSLIGDWGKGHSAAPRDLWTLILRNIVLYEKNLNDLIERNEGEKLVR
ncbi:hypothetical protein CAL20_13215 [Bordetella genomosp. 4]|uniref:Uncharacterized protein n=2 Tax=Bordetella genomosp. 4 TaxID=463044 RepID=A0A261U3C9_9BORD|nr:hypothetical protein CAL20_13215 [Bordetella genomosp. 4]